MKGQILSLFQTPKPCDNKGESENELITVVMDSLVRILSSWANCSWPSAVMISFCVGALSFSTGLRGLAFGLGSGIRDFVRDIAFGLGGGISDIVFGLGGGIRDILFGLGTAVGEAASSLAAAADAVWIHTSLQNVSRIVGLGLLFVLVPSMAIQVQSILTKWLPAYLGILPKQM